MRPSLISTPLLISNLDFSYSRKQKHILEREFRDKAYHHIEPHLDTSSGNASAIKPERLKFNPNAIVYFEGGCKRYGEANLSIGAEAVQYGNLCFEGVIAYWNEDQKQLYIFKADDHYKRLVDSAKYLDIELGETQEDFKNIIVSLLKQNNRKSHTYIRPFAYRSDDIIGFTANGSTDFGVYLMPIDRDVKSIKGLNVCKSNLVRASADAMPLWYKIGGHYYSSAHVKRDALKKGFDDAIFFTHEGNISEATVSNVFIVNSKDELITPPKSANILMGITRDTILQLGKELGINAKEEHIHESAFKDAKEVFFTGTYVGMAPVVSFEGKPIGKGSTGPVFKELHKKYFDIVLGNTEHKEWLTPVY